MQYIFYDLWMCPSSAHWNMAGRPCLRTGEGPPKLVLTRALFPVMFEKILNERETEKIIKNGFRKCELYPLFDLDATDYTKCISNESRVMEQGQGTQNPQGVCKTHRFQCPTFALCWVLHVWPQSRRVQSSWKCRLDWRRNGPRIIWAVEKTQKKVFNKQ